MRSHRLALAWLLAAGGALAPAHAQRVDLGNVLRNALNPATYRCKTLLEWVRTPALDAAEPHGGDVPARRAPAAGGIDARTLFLVSDEVFRKHFGKGYDELTQQDFREFQQSTARACMQGGEFRPDEWQTVQRLWNPYQQAQVLRAAQARRAEQAAADRTRAGAQADLHQAMAELETADIATLSVDGVAALRGRAQAAAARLGPQAQQDFDRRYQRWAERQGAEVVRRRIQDVLQTPTEPALALAQVQAAAGLAAGRAPLGIALPGDDPALLALQRREREIATALADQDRRAMDGWPDGLAGLEAGVQWQRQFDARRAGLARPVPELDATLGDFTRRRQQVLARSTGLLTAAVEQSLTIAQAQGIKSRYLLPSESGLPAARAVDEAIDRRVRLIERNEALGRPTPAGAAVAAAAPAPPARATTRPPPVSEARAAAAAPASGEPSEEVMYDLVRQKFETAAAKVKGVYDQCAGGGDRSNPMNAMMCAAYNLQRGATGGAAAAPTRIVRFGKIGCEKSPSQPGYNCEYEIQTDSPIRNQFAKMTGFQVDENGFGQGRFVRNREGVWLMITRE